MQDNNSKKHFWLYILELEDNKCYVGITSKTPEKRMQQHLSGFLGAKWTKKYKPIRILSTEDLGYISFADAEKHENKIVRQYIKKYGIDNVRGGDISYSGEMLERFGLYWQKDSWLSVLSIVIIFFVIAYLLVVIYF
ncbi:MAG: GIY-YIG nuclease family protein [Candidatus Saccharimonadales bacterium]